MIKKVRFKFYLEFKNKEGNTAFVDQKGQGCDKICDGKSLARLMMAIWRNERGCTSFKEYKVKTGKSAIEDFNSFYVTVLVNGADIKSYQQTNYEFYRLMLI